MELSNFQYGELQLLSITCDRLLQELIAEGEDRIIKLQKWIDTGFFHGPNMLSTDGNYTVLPEEAKELKEEILYIRSQIKFALELLQVEKQ